MNLVVTLRRKLHSIIYFHCFKLVASTTSSLQQTLFDAKDFHVCNEMLLLIYRWFSEQNVKSQKVENNNCKFDLFVQSMQ